MVSPPRSGGGGPPQAVEGAAASAPLAATRHSPRLAGGEPMGFGTSPASGGGKRSRVTLLAVAGMQRESKLLRGRCDVIVAGSDNSTLAARIEQAIASGARALLSFGICG